MATNFVFRAPVRTEIERKLRVRDILKEFKRRNSNWCQDAIKQWYARHK